MNKERFYNPFEYMDSVESVKNTKNIIDEKRPILAELIEDDGKIIYINKSPFVIGKSPNRADLVLASRTVSGVHATIIIDENKHYLIDNESTNGTFLNGTKLNSNERVLLHTGDMIKLAHTNLTFIS